MPGARSALVAYLLLVRAWGQGYAREALAVVVAHLFARDDASRVEALIDTRNSRSIRLVESLGFERVELIERADHFERADSDEYRYRLIRPR
jgi:RimJ/RimL family protein N-acetyltransferase